MDPTSVIHMNSTTLQIPQPSADKIIKKLRFKKQQRKCAAALESGKRLLVRWPRGRTDLEMAAYSMEVARSAAASARAALV